jgi:hypothetical protein
MAAEHEPDGIVVEMASGAPVVPREVEGFSTALIDAYQGRRLPMPPRV